MLFTQKKTIRNTFFTLFLIFIVIFSTSCTLLSSNEQIKERPLYGTLIMSNKPIILKATTKTENSSESYYQWYRSLDSTTDNSIVIVGATDCEYTVDVFTDRDVKYFYCVTTNIVDEHKSFTTSRVFSIINTGLPTLYIDTDNSEITKGEYVEDCDLTLVDIDDSQASYDELKIKGRGNTSWRMPKKSYSLKLHKKKSLLNMEKDKKWVLIANYDDKSLLRNYFASSIGNNIFDNMEWNPSFEFVDLILDGNYLGNYLLGEKIKIADNRVNIQDMSDIDDDVNGDGKTNINDGGFIIEVNERMDEDYNFRTTHNVAISLSDPDDKEDVSEDMFAYAKNIVQSAEYSLYSPNFKDPNEGYSKYFDVDSVIDWYLVNEFTKNNDASFFSSVYLYYNPVTEKLYMGPNWDFDISCGNVNYNNSDDYTGFRIKNSKWIKKMFEDPAFVEKVKIRWNEVKDELNTAVNQDLQNNADELKVSANYNFKKWPILGSYVWPNADGYKERDTYQKEVDYMINWLNNRYTWLDKNFQNL